jgi:large subunit ribosomal protein L4
MELPIYSSKGTKLNKKVKLDDSVFNVPVNEKLLAQALYVYRSNQRKGTAHTKIRSEVRGGGAKPWAQKGTGRARHGSIRSPIWKGGGITFGPRKDRVYQKKMPKKMKKASIRSAFSSFAKEKRIYIIEKVEFKKEHLTKQLLSLVDKMSVKDKVLFIHKGDEKSLYLAGRNVKNIEVFPVNEMNIYILMNADSLVILKDALEKISVNWGKEKAKKEPVTKKIEKRVVSRDVSGDISDLKLSKRVITALEKQGIRKVKKLHELAESKKLAELKGIGQKSREEILKVLSIK